MKLSHQWSFYLTKRARFLRSDDIAEAEKPLCALILVYLRQLITTTDLDTYGMTMICMQAKGQSLYSVQFLNKNQAQETIV